MVKSITIAVGVVAGLILAGLMLKKKNGTTPSEISEEIKEPISEIGYFEPKIEEITEKMVSIEMPEEEEKKLQYIPISCPACKNKLFRQKMAMLK